jgi:AcrR family transcriptional regulator
VLSRKAKGSGVSTRDDILAVATELFALKGYRETSMAELCEKSGIAEGTIFYHFKNKETLFLLILERVTREIMDLFTRMLDQTTFSDGLTMIEGLSSFYVTCSRNLGPRYLLLHRHFSYELARKNPVCRQHLQALYGFLINRFESGLERGIRDGSIRPLSSSRVAVILLAMIDGFVRLQTFELYEIDSLTGDLLDLLRGMLRPGILPDNLETGDDS